MEHERKCNECIHHISGRCSAWECDPETLEEHDEKVMAEKDITEPIKSMLERQYQRGRTDAIKEFVKAIEKRQTRQDNYLDPPRLEMGLDITDVLEVAEQLKEKK